MHGAEQCCPHREGCCGVFTLSGAGSLLGYLSCLFLCLSCYPSWAPSVMHVRVLVH